MGMFPWDDWFYNLSKEKAEISGDYQDYVAKRDQISISGVAYNDRYKDCVTLMTYNKALLIIAAVAQLNQVDYGEWLETNIAETAPDPQTPTVILVFQGLAELVGFAFLGNVIFTLGKVGVSAIRTGLAKAAQGSVNELGVALQLEQPAINEMSDLAMTQIGEEITTSITEAAIERGVQVGTEAGIESASEAVATASIGSTIAASGIGIFIAVGFDMILGAIDGAIEKQQLDEGKNRLEKALSVVGDYLKKIDGYSADLATKIIGQESDFLMNIKILENIQKSDINYNLAPTLDNMPEFKQEMAKATTYYGWLVTIRNSWINFSKNKPDKPWADFVSEMLDLHPSTMTNDQAKGFLDYAKVRIDG